MAIKVLPKGRIQDDEAITRFEREMMAVGQLDHSNVVRAYDAREIEGTWFLVMEFVDGLDLAEFVRRYGPLPVADACEVIRQAALGLESAHQHHLVHRDIKPSNLMLTSEGQVKLLDLGLARFQLEQPAGAEMTRTGQALGTLDYMAPEQIYHTHSVDIRADIYSLGCTLYKLLTGQAPFSGPGYEGDYEKMRAHLSEPVPPIRQVRGDVPPELVAVMNRMLAKEPGLRYGTPAEVADAVGPLATGSDLPGLLARAADKPPVVQRVPSLVGTQGSLSSGLTRFFQRVKAERHRPGVRSSRPEEDRWAKLTIIIGTAAVGILLMAILIALAVKSHSGLPDEVTALVFDWPESERQDVSVFVNGEEVLFPASGPFTVRGEEGKNTIYAERKGFKHYESVETLRSGDQKEVPWPKWQRLSHLVLQWPVDQRRGAELLIDGKRPDFSDRAIEQTREHIKVPTEAGEHLVRIVWREFNAPFEQRVTIAAEEDQMVVVPREWPPASTQAKPAPPSVAPEQPTRGGTEKPAATEQDYLEALRPIMRMVAAGDSGHALEALKGLHFQEKELQERLDRYRERVQALADYAQAVQPARKLAAAWDFAGAAAALEKVQVQGEDLAARLAARRTMVGRLVTLKQRIIGQINAAKPPKRKIDLGIPGWPGNVTKADQNALTVELATGKVEIHRWIDLQSKARQKLLELGVDPKSADDWLAAALLALDAGDEGLTEEYLAKALPLGAMPAPCLVPFAEAHFPRAERLLKNAAVLPKEEFAQEERLFKEADGLLQSTKTRYGGTPWFKDEHNQEALHAATAEVAAGIRRAEADWLYVEAEKYFKENDLFYLRLLVKKLKEYQDTRAVKDNPSFAKMDGATAGLGDLIVVRKTAKEVKKDLPLPEKVIQDAIDAAKHRTSIQAAIGDAPPNSLIEIQDSAIYDETIVIAEDKKGLTLWGEKTCWPVIRRNQPTKELVEVIATDTTFERLVLLLDQPIDDHSECLDVLTGTFRARWVIVHALRSYKGFHTDYNVKCEVDDCLFVTCMALSGGAVFQNCLLLDQPRSVRAEPRCEFRCATVIGTVDIVDQPSDFFDSIVRNISNPRRRKCTMEHSTVFGEQPVGSRPQFRDPDHFDFRLRENSPGRGEASNHGDIGVRYDDEAMLEMCRKALELKERGLIQFEYKP